MVRAVMAELHLERAPARREAEQLVAEADAERRHAAVDDLADRRDRVVAGLGIAGAVATGTRRRASCASTSRAGVCAGTTVSRQPRCGEHAQDVVLDAVVVGDDVEARLAHRPIAVAERPRARRPLVGLGAGHDLARDRVPPSTARRARARSRRRRPRRSMLGAGDDAAVLRALLAQDARELARVDVGDADDVRAAQIRRQVVRACASSTRGAAGRGSRAPPRRRAAIRRPRRLTPTLPMCG